MKYKYNKEKFNSEEELLEFNKNNDDGSFFATAIILDDEVVVYTQNLSKPTSTIKNT